MNTVYIGGYKLENWVWTGDWSCTRWLFSSRLTLNIARDFIEKLHSEFHIPSNP